MLNAINISKIFLCCILFALIHPANASVRPNPPCLSKYNNAMTDKLKEKGAILTNIAQMDYASMQKSSACFFEAWPNTAEQIKDLVALAYQHNIPIRTQGARHSQNGSSLPHNEELLIHTSHLNHIIFTHQGSVSIEAGTPILLAKQLIAEKSSFFLPIYNDGGIGPTLGGYISAGGIGRLSVEFGGLWEHVKSITLVTAEGKIKTVTESDPLFKWLFGSMGQLGIIVRAELEILPDHDKPLFYPLNLSITANKSDISAAQSSAQTIKPLYWFNLFIPDERHEEAKKDLENLKIKYPHALAYLPVDKPWYVPFIKKIAPLVFNHKQNFVATALWGHLNNAPDNLEQFNLLHKDFAKLVNRKKYARYIQVEVVSSPSEYKAYFDPTVYAKFKHYKKQLDPKFLFNRNTVFD